MSKLIFYIQSIIRFLLSTFSHLVLLLIRFYQSAVSPYIRPCCRYTPTCSAYASEAVERYGLGRGLLLALKRLLRCHPLHAGGYDPVPFSLERAGGGKNSEKTFYKEMY